MSSATERTRRVEIHDADALRQPPRQAVAQSTTFDDLERSVIELSRRDPISSVEGRAARRLDPRSWLDGYRPTPLAIPRLEELRRFAILTRVHSDPGDDALDRFLDAGFSFEQAVLVHVILHDGQPASTEHDAERLLWAAMLLVALGVYIVVFRQLGEVLPSLVVAGTVFVTIASITAPRRPSHY